MDLLTVGLTIVLTLLIYFIFNSNDERTKISKQIDVLGGERKYPIIGTTLGFLKAGAKGYFRAFHRRNMKYGPLFRSYIGNYPVVHIMKAQYMEAVLKRNANYQKSDFYTMFKPWLGDGLITVSDGDLWRTHRKLITPSFHFNILDNFTEIMSNKTEKLADQVKEIADGQFRDFCPYIISTSLEIICGTAMGIEIDTLSSLAKYTKAINTVTASLTYRIANPFLHNDFIFSLSKTGRLQDKSIKYLHSISDQVIRDRKEKLTHGNVSKNNNKDDDEVLGKKKKLAFLDTLLMMDGQLSDKEIRDEVETFLFGGHDTTSNAIGYALFYLGHHPEVQKRAQEEIDSIFHGENRPITTKDLTETKYLERVIKETLRLLPVVPSHSRILGEDIILDGHKIPAGVMVQLHIYELHRDPKYFPEPEKFNPDRFLPENFKNIHPFAYLPFSAGSRNCIGQKFGMNELKCYLISLLRRYNVKSLYNKLEDLDLSIQGGVMKAGNGVHLAFTERNQINK